MFDDSCFMFGTWTVFGSNFFPALVCTIKARNLIVILDENMKRKDVQLLFSI